MASLPLAGYIQATIAEIRTDSVCGVTDQVKVISLQAKNGMNQNIAHIINDKKIILSKNYGLTHVFDMVLFPKDTIPRTLSGKCTPPIGLQDFPIGDAYDFNVGDEFHTDYYAGCTLGATGIREIRIILSKSMSATGDTIVYLTDRCSHSMNFPPITYYNNHDTTADTIILHNHDFYSSFYRQPFEFEPKSSTACDLFLRYSGGFNNHPKKRFYVNYYIKNLPSSNCWSYNDNKPYYEYAEGLGQTRFFNQYLIQDPNQQWITVTYDWRLVYYRKGNETWGTPLASDCSELLLDVNETPADTLPALSIAPNPATDGCVIKVTGIASGESAELSLYDCTGREIFRSGIQTDPYSLSRAGIPDGFYVVRVTSRDGRLNLTSKIILY